MNKEDFALGKMNFILAAVAAVVIIIGFVLMSGGGNKGGIEFSDAIFDTRRIVVAPVVCMIGFVLMGVAILKNDKKGTVE